MRIITRFLSVIGVAALVMLAVFGGVYLWNEYAPSSVGSSADRPGVTTAANETETIQQAQSPLPAAPGEIAPSSPESASAPTSPQVPAGYVLEDCEQGIGATGKTVYYRPPLPPERTGWMHTYWFECVHHAGDSAVVNVVSSSGSPPRITGNANSYCAFSTASKNIGCALEPITSKDLMNPS